MKTIYLVIAYVFLITVSVPTLSQTQNNERGKRGAVVPQNLEAIVTAQTQATEVGATLLGGLNRTPRPQQACNATMNKFSWKELKKVTPVQNQGECGSCWVFAAIAAFEASYLIENNFSVDQGNTPEASEQQALDCSWKAYSCNGGWHDKVFIYLKQNAAAHKRNYRPYRAEKSSCEPVLNKQYTAIQWGFVGGKKKPHIPPDEILKAAICDHGPIVSAVDSSAWDAEKDNQFYLYSKHNPNWTVDFPNGVFKGTPSKPNLNMSNINPTGDRPEVDHDVLIVGWNDDEGAWIVKNSWGTRWGDDGYIKVAYGTLNIGFNAAWIQANTEKNGVPLRTLNAISKVNEEFRYKNLQIAPK